MMPDAVEGKKKSVFTMRSFACKVHGTFRATDKLVFEQGLER